MKTKKIIKLLCLSLSFFMLCLNITTINAEESNMNVIPRYGSLVTCNYSFSNYTVLPSNPIYECYVGTNGGINVQIYPNVSSSKYTMTFELVRDTSKTGKKKTISMVTDNRISWGDLPSGKYQVKVTSTYANYDTDKRAVGYFKIYYGD